MLLERLLASSGEGPPLRVAALLDEEWCDRPDARVIDLLLRSRFAAIVLVVHERRPLASSRPAGILDRLADPRRRSRLLFDLYDRWDRKRSRAVDRLDGAVDLAGRLAEIPSLSVEKLGDEDAVRFPEDALARIRAQGIDVAVRFAAGHLSRDAAHIARYGIWSYDHGDAEHYRGGPAHFWELVERNPVSGVSLEAMTPPHGDRIVLCKGHAATSSDPSDLSLARNRIKPHLLGGTFLLRKLKELHEDGFAALERNAVSGGPYLGKRRTYRVPSNLEMAAFLVPRLAGKARLRLLERPKLAQWRVGVRVNGAARIEADRPLALDGFRWIEAPRGRLHADPFLIERSGQVYCFFEDLDHARHLGRISCAAVDPDGSFREVRPALELPYHLSYPFVFEDGGDTFMVPESRRNGTVDLFRAVEFPGRWEKVRTLLEGPGLDATVLRAQGLYWFFVAVREPEGAGEQLLLFHAGSLDGELTFHAMNPISADIRSCRPAGAIFRQGGRLVRPVQDCSVTYGHQLSFAEIVTLTPDSYREEIVATVSPPAGMNGIHTYNRLGAIEVVDGKRLEPAARHLAREAER